MRYLYVCNTSSDYLSKVNLETFKEECKINLRLDALSRVGPHGICTYKNNIIVANSYGNSISIIDIDSDEVIESFFIGMHCNDVVVCNDNAYIICGESNNVIVFDLTKNKIIEEIPCGNHPHSIDIDRQKNILIVTNMESDNITMIDCNDRENIHTIRVGRYPTKAIFTSDGNYILVCESNIGTDYCGAISIISAINRKLLFRIAVGNSPVDFYHDNNYCYVSNFGEGSISILNLKNNKEMKKVQVGGMPRGIIKIQEYIYAGDNYNNLLLRMDILSEKKKAISIGGEPTGMTLVNRL